MIARLLFRFTAAVLLTLLFAAFELAAAPADSAACESGQLAAATAARIAAIVAA